MKEEKSFKQQVLELRLEYIDEYALVFTTLVAQLHYLIIKRTNTDQDSYVKLAHTMADLIKSNLAIALVDPDPYIREFAILIANDY